MEFRTGDNVVHPTHGVGRVLRCEEQQLAGGDPHQYYVLACGPATVWVPLQTDGTTTLRAVTTKKELEQYRSVLKSQPLPLERDHNKRRADINTRLAEGSFRVLCEVVRDLTALGWKHRISEADLVMLHKVRANLEREWALASGLSEADTLKEIDGLLQMGQETHQVQH